MFVSFKIYATDVTSGAGTTFPAGAPKFTPFRGFVLHKL